jgi:predicted phage terminase large subunit-like protein
MTVSMAADQGKWSALRYRIHDELDQRKRYDWSLCARPQQKIPDGSWRIWLILAGRGFGKTRTGAETVRQWIRQGTYRRICLLGNHYDDTRRVMIQGQSGLLSVCAPNEGVRYWPSRHSVLWPCGGMATAYSAQSYQTLRGPQFDAAWIDELAKFQYAQESWDQLMLGLRLGTLPRVIITTTPRPTPLLKELIKRKDVHITQGTTFDNQDNLPGDYIHNLKTNYAHTRMGAQELYGQMVQDTHDSLWKPDLIKRCLDIPPCVRIVVAIDPAVTQRATSDETGIIIAGKDAQGHGYILGDQSGHMSPTQWITQAVKALHHHKGDRIIAEVNNGGDLVEHLLHTLFAGTPYRAVHATRNKMARAEPVSALYERGLIFHCGYFHQLEEQMLAPKSFRSPDRLDALVWALTELFLVPQAKRPSISRIE